MQHIPVLVKECLQMLNSGKGKTIIDCTLGLGGHTKELMKTGCRVISIDRDEKAIESVKKELPDNVIIHSSFSKLKEVLSRLSISKVDGILADLGVSTYQLEDSERGFGFEGKLDMRMDTTQKTTAYNIINDYTQEQLSKLLFDYGERRFSRQIARAISNSRVYKPIETGEELLAVVKSVMPPKYRFSREHHWATPTFRALRMEVNADLEELKALIAAAPDCLNQNGRLVIISFHSIEDKIVKHEFKALSKKGFKILTKRPLEATEEEISKNSKSQRAKLRAIEKV